MKLKRERKTERDKIISCIFGGMDIFWLDDAKVVSSDDKIAWKGGYFYLTDDKTGKIVTYPVLIKLSIPKDAYRTHYGNKDCEQYAKHRCSYAKVLGFYSYYTGKELTKYDNETAHTMFDCIPRYKKGLCVKPDEYTISNCVCGHGIHFFWSKTSAMLYLDGAINKSDLRRKNSYF